MVLGRNEWKEILRMFAKVKPNKMLRLKDNFPNLNQKNFSIVSFGKYIPYIYSFDNENYL